MKSVCPAFSVPKFTSALLELTLAPRVGIGYNSSMTLCRMLVSALLLWLAFPLFAQERPSPDAVKLALRKATDYLVSISTEGGYLWSYSADLKQRRGEEVATATQIWVQSPGTPAVGEAFLKAYAATRDEAHLRAALGAANALVRGQLESGGWSYVIEFDPKLRSQWAYHADSTASKPDFKSRRNTTTFDDNNTQGALTFLLTFLEVATNLPPEQLKPVRAALDFGLARMLDAQYPIGAWPQRFSGEPHDPAKHPIRPASIATNWLREWPRADYGGFYTLNDNTQSDCIRTMLAAYRHTGDKRFLDAAKRGGDFFVLAQLPEPQPAWAQQYNYDMQPAWARAFEPPSVCTGESAGVVRTLGRLYLETGDEKYLRSAPAFVAWVQRSQLSSNRWARLYELETNKPIYGDRDGKIHYTLEELSAERRRGYSWQGSFDLPETIQWYERLRRDGREKTLADEKRRKAPSRPNANSVAAILNRQDASGRWTNATGISMRQFVSNLGTLADYLATQ
ncbi:MAG TPA: pectate lyase [Verrucomicrobiae bacterium]|nr:pectate lyase [Verrucomicrobiae bacterium]